MNHLKHEITNRRYILPRTKTQKSPQIHQNLQNPQKTKKSYTSDPIAPRMERTSYAISPRKRLYIAREALKYGTKETAANMGLCKATINKWVCAYKVKGREAHIFKVGGNNWREEHEVKTDKGRWACKFSVEEKGRILQGVGVGGKSNAQVACEWGLCPETIGKWRKEFRDRDNNNNKVTQNNTQSNTKNNTKNNPNPDNGMYILNISTDIKEEEDKK